MILKNTTVHGNVYNIPGDSNAINEQQTEQETPGEEEHIEIEGDQVRVPPVVVPPIQDTPPVWDNPPVAPAPHVKQKSWLRKKIEGINTTRAVIYTALALSGYWLLDSATIYEKEGRLGEFEQFRYNYQQKLLGDQRIKITKPSGENYTLTDNYSLKERVNRIDLRGILKHESILKDKEDAFNLDRGVIEKNVLFAPFCKEVYTRRFDKDSRYAGKSYGRAARQNKFRDLEYLGRSCYKQIRNQANR